MRSRRGLGMALVAAGLSASMASGCGLGSIRPDGESPREATLPELLGRIESRTAGLESLRALIAVEAGGGQPFVAALNWVRPENLHVIGLNPFGTPLFEVMVADGMVEWSAPDRPPVLLGRTESLGRSEWLDPQGIPVPPEDLVRMMRMLTGPLLEKDEQPLLESTRRYFLIHVVRRDGDQTRLTKRFYIDRRSFRVLRQDLFGPEGSVRLKVRFREFRATSRGDWAYRMIVNTENRKAEIGLVFRELQFDPAVSPEEFRLKGEGPP